MTDDKRLEKHITLDATVDEVWEAVSTGPGFSAWFVPHRFHTGPDGAVEAEADFGSGNTSTGTITAWEPPHRVVYASRDDGNTEALEFIVEGRDGAATQLRLVQSGITGEDWELEYHSHGWDHFFHNLASYLTYFRGRPVSNALAMGFTTLDSAAVWDRFHDALGTHRGLSIGDHVDLKPSGAEPVKGVVDLYKDDNFLGIRTDSGLHRFMGEGANAWGMVSAVHYHYGTGIDVQKWVESWNNWLLRQFPPNP